MKPDSMDSTAISPHGKLWYKYNKTFEDEPTFEDVIFGHFNRRGLELTYVFERGLVFKCHMCCTRPHHWRSPAAPRFSAAAPAP